MTKKCVKLLNALRRINLGIKENRLPGVLCPKKGIFWVFEETRDAIHESTAVHSNTFPSKFSLSPGISSKDIEWLAFKE